MATYTLKDNDVVIDKLSGAVSLSYLKQDYDDITDTQNLFPPVMLIGDHSTDQYKLCDPCEEENNCFDISNESFFSLISNLPSPNSEIDFFLSFIKKKDRTDKISSIMYKNDNSLFNMNWSIMSTTKFNVYTEYRIIFILFNLNLISRSNDVAYKSEAKKYIDKKLKEWGFINLVNFLNFIATINGWKRGILKLDTDVFFDHIYYQASEKILSDNTRLKFTNPSSYIKQFAPDDEVILKNFYNILANKQLQKFVTYIKEKTKNDSIEMLDFILNQTDPKKLDEMIDDSTNYSIYFDFLFNIVAAPFIVIDFTLHLLNAKNGSTSFMFAFIEDKYLVMIQDFLNSFYNYKIIHDIRPNPKKEQYNCLEIDFLLNISDEMSQYSGKKQALIPVRSRTSLKSVPQSKKDKPEQSVGVRSALKPVGSRLMPQAEKSSAAPLLELRSALKPAGPRPESRVEEEPELSALFSKLSLKPETSKIKKDDQESSVAAAPLSSPSKRLVLKSVRLRAAAPPPETSSDEKIQPPPQTPSDEEELPPSAAVGALSSAKEVRPPSAAVAEAVPRAAVPKPALSSTPPSAAAVAAAPTAVPKDVFADWNADAGIVRVPQEEPPLFHDCIKPENGNIYNIQYFGDNFLYVIGLTVTVADIGAAVVNVKRSDSARHLRIKLVQLESDSKSYDALNIDGTSLYLGFKDVFDGAPITIDVAEALYNEIKIEVREDGLYNIKMIGPLKEEYYLIPLGDNNTRNNSPLTISAVNPSKPQPKSGYCFVQVEQKKQGGYKYNYSIDFYHCY